MRAFECWLEDIEIVQYRRSIAFCNQMFANGIADPTLQTVNRNRFSESLNQVATLHDDGRRDGCGQRRRYVLKYTRLIYIHSAVC